MYDKTLRWSVRLEMKYTGNRHLFQNSFGAVARSRRVFPCRETHTAHEEGQPGRISERNAPFRAALSHTLCESLCQHCFAHC